jgi:hypothetical protein
MNMRLRISIRWMKLAFTGVGMPNGGITSEGRPGQKRDETRITIIVASNATGSDQRLPLWINGLAKIHYAMSGAIIRRLGCITKLWNNSYTLSTYGSVDRDVHRKGS